MQRPTVHNQSARRRGFVEVHFEFVHDIAHPIEGGFVQREQGHALGQEIAGMANVHGRFHLVPRQDPDLDAGLAELRDALRHAGLKSVFDGGGTDQLEIPLDGAARVGNLNPKTKQSIIQSIEHSKN